MSIRSVVSDHTTGSKSAQPGAKVEQPLDAVAEALARMRFGVIQLTVHDGRLVQLDVTERRRFA